MTLFWTIVIPIAAIVVALMIFANLRAAYPADAGVRAHTRTSGA